MFFHLSDTFYNACASLTLAGAAEVFFSRLNWSAGKRVVMALLMGVLPFLAAPARIFHQVYNSAIDFWSLTRIVPFTINEYPFWNYVFADNHAHNNAAYLDVLITFFS